MKNSKILLPGGILILFLGVVFNLQGNTIIGPESSFMYSNPQWITYGFMIIILGAIIVIIGICFRILRTK